MFRLVHEIGSIDVTAYAPDKTTVGSLDLTIPYQGYTACEVINAAVTIQTASDAALTVQITLQGIGQADVALDPIVIAAAGTSGRLDISRALTLAEYQTVLVEAWCNSKPLNPAIGLTAMLTTQYPPTGGLVVESGTALMSFADARAVKPPDSPLKGSGAYEQNLFLRACDRVQDITGRQLASDTYVETGYTVELDRADDSVAYAYYPKDPTDDVLTYTGTPTTDSITSLELNGNTVDPADVVIQESRLLFNQAGRVAVTYKGGYMRSTQAAAVITAAVVRCMEIMHQRDKLRGFGGVSGSSLQSEDTAFQPVADMLHPYTRFILPGADAPRPDDP